MLVEIPKIADISFASSAVATAWNSLAWLELRELPDRRTGLRTRCKLAWSSKGIYALVDCEDRTLTCTELRDFDDLFEEDVVEVFLWPDEGSTVYFEYEISPLAHELVLLVPNHRGTFMGWAPWHYEGDRSIRKIVHVRGGEQRPGSAVEGWTAEIFIPFALLRGLGNCPPAEGSRWRGNVFRMDYDSAPRAKWALCPVTDGQFHNYFEFAELRFA